MRGDVFTDRAEAGRLLAVRLRVYQGDAPVVLALPRGGVPVAFEIARDLGAPLDLLMVRKIGAPGQPELAVGAVVDGGHPETVLNDEIVGALGVPADYIAAETERQLREIERRRRLYLGGGRRVELTGRTAIVVDDGIATGATARAALRAVRRAGPRRVVLAAPVAAADAVDLLRRDADDVVVLDAAVHFGAISQFYAEFHQLSDAEVTELMDRARGAGG